MYEELVKRLRQQVECDKKTYPQGPPYETLLIDLAADAIEELSRDLDSMNEANIALYGALPHWNSVEEALPEIDQKVLAWVKNKDPEGRFNQNGIYTAELKDKVPKPDPEGKKNFWGIPGYDSVWTVWSWSYFSEPDVLYWQPLPEPPKEET